MGGMNFLPRLFAFSRSLSINPPAGCTTWHAEWIDCPGSTSVCFALKLPSSQPCTAVITFCYAGGCWLLPVTIFGWCAFVCWHCLPQPHPLSSSREYFDATPTLLLERARHTEERDTLGWCHISVRIDSLGIVACNLSPRDICKRIAWLAEGSEPAYIWVGILNNDIPILQLLRRPILFGEMPIMGWSSCLIRQATRWRRHSSRGLRRQSLITLKSLV